MHVKTIFNTNEFIGGVELLLNMNMSIGSPGQPKPCSSLCGACYRANTQIWSCVRLHAGGPSLAPNPPAYRIQGRLLGVAMPIGPRSDLPNRPLSTCIGFSK